MQKKRFLLILGVGVLLLGIGYTTFYLTQLKPRRMTFEACEIAGGVAWRVDLYHPDICPSCAEYQECAFKFNDYRTICPECYEACPECQDQYSLYDSCPECYGPCQSCQNKYLNDFENDDERLKLCPECEECDNCRQELEKKKSNCPPCLSCSQCREENKKDQDIYEACPQVIPCNECLDKNFPYPDQCPDGKEKIGEISDAAIWFQCCK